MSCIGSSPGPKPALSQALPLLTVAVAKSRILLLDSALAFIAVSRRPLVAPIMSATAIALLAAVAVTVAILAQGTPRAVAPALAFLHLLVRVLPARTEPAGVLLCRPLAGLSSHGFSWHGKHQVASHGIVHACCAVAAWRPLDSKQTHMGMEDCGVGRDGSR